MIALSRTLSVSVAKFRDSSRLAGTFRQKIAASAPRSAFPHLSAVAFGLNSQRFAAGWFDSDSTFLRGGLTFGRHYGTERSGASGGAAFVLVDAVDDVGGGALVF